MSQFLHPGIDFGNKEINMVCPSITPTLTELVINGNMELDANWVNLFTPATNERSNEQAHGGTYSRKVVGDGANDGIRQSVTLVKDTWYQRSVWIYVTAGTAINQDVNGLLVGSFATSAAAWTNFVLVNRATAGGASHVSIAQLDATALTAYLDDASLCNISNATVYLGKRSGRPGTYRCHPTVADNSQCGILLSYLNATNFVMLIVNRAGTDQAQLLKVINGVYASVIAGNITYSAEKELAVVVNGTDYSLYYNNTQIGATTAITDGGLGTMVYGFNTYASNTVGTVTTSAATTYSG